MKISPDQNTITLDDGAVLVAQESAWGCRDCYFAHRSICLQCEEDIPCDSYDRVDRLDVIFIEEPKK